MKNVMMIVAAAGLAAAASAQVTVVSASGLARATAGDGSGSNQQASTNTAGWSLSATKNFSNNGHVQASTSWSLNPATWTLSGSFSLASFAQSQGQAGYAETETLVNFDAPQDLDLEYSGGAGFNSPFYNLTMEMRNRVTNAYVVGGSSPNFVHIPAGQYKFTLDSSLGYGDGSGGFNVEFRPGNDRCTFARLIGLGSHSGSTQFATNDGQATCGSSNLSPSVWYKYVATRTGPLDINTCGSGFDTVLSVYDTNSCPSGTGTQIACNDDAPAGSPCGGTRSALSVSVVAGETYYIRLSGYNDAAGEYVLNVGPVNDHCEDATPVTFGSYPFNNTHANTDGPVLTVCTAGGADNQVNGDLWYVVTPPDNGAMSIDTCGSGFDTKLAIYQNAPCRGRSVYLGCSDDACGYQSQVSGVQVQRGVAYYIRVGGYLTERGAGVLNINFLPDPPCLADFNNDDSVDFFDYDDFVACFEGAACPPGTDADFNNDGSTDFFDYDDFVAAFEIGC
jgi:hypothetical protein